jgi:hypothetical protein
MDTLSRLSHDVDQEVAMGAIVAMGLIGGGTNNARIAGMLRNLSSYYYKEPNLLFTVRIAQVSSERSNVVFERGACESGGQWNEAVFRLSTANSGCVKSAQKRSSYGEFCLHSRKQVNGVER